MKEHNEQQAEEIQRMIKLVETGMCTEEEAAVRIKHISERRPEPLDHNFTELTKRIINQEGSWIDSYRGEWLLILWQIIGNGGEYNSAINGLIYSYWKAEKSIRLMSTETPPDMKYFSMENAWGVLNDLNLGYFEIPQDLIRWISTEADCI